jgi:hypothetical protein
LLDPAGACALHHEGVDVAFVGARYLCGAAAHALGAGIHLRVHAAARGAHVHARVEGLARDRLGVHRHVDRAHHFAPETGPLARHDTRGVELQVHRSSLALRAQAVGTRGTRAGVSRT